MVNVPALTPTDVFKTPRPLSSPANLADWKVPSPSDEKTRKSQALGGLKAGGKYVDVVVPQAPSAAEKVRYSTMGAPLAPYAFRREQDDAIVPEFKTQQHRAAPAAVPEPHHAFQLTSPPAAVPDLDFLDMDDWTSPFDLELSFDSIFDSWDEHHLLFNEARRMDQTRHAVVGERSASSEQSNDVASAENQSNGSAQVPSQESSEVSEEVDEFTRNRRLCLQRYREKKRNRKFSKKVRYHLRKMNADRRPRYKGRFIKKGEVIPQELLDAEKQKRAQAAAAAAAK